MARTGSVLAVLPQILSEQIVLQTRNVSAFGPRRMNFWTIIWYNEGNCVKIVLW